MRLNDRKRLGQVPEIAASTAASYNDMAMGSPFWPSVGVGVFTGVVVWGLHRVLDHFFPRRARA